MASIGQRWKVSIAVPIRLCDECIIQLMGVLDPAPKIINPPFKCRRASQISHSRVKLHDKKFPMGAMITTHGRNWPRTPASNAPLSVQTLKRGNKNRLITGRRPSDLQGGILIRKTVAATGHYSLIDTSVDDAALLHRGGVAPKPSPFRA